MRRHWQKKPLLVRAAQSLASVPRARRARLFALAARDDVESRLVVRDGARWSLRHGPLARRALPSLATRGWTLLVQGVDLHDEAAHRLLRRFRFVADARLDDLMCSYASDGGGVGPHLDSYDVFLLQAAGRRRWRIGRGTRAAPARRRAAQDARRLRAAPTNGCSSPATCSTCRRDGRHEGVGGGRVHHGVDRLSRAAQRPSSPPTSRSGSPKRSATRPTRSRPPATVASATPASLPRRSRRASPSRCSRFADAAVERLLGDRRRARRALGEILSEPKPRHLVRARRRKAPETAAPSLLDRRTRMLYDDRFVFINGEAFRAAGRDATLMRRLADARRLEREARWRRRATSAKTLLAEWLRAGWCRRAGRDDDEESP